MPIALIQIPLSVQNVRLIFMPQISKRQGLALINFYSPPTETIKLQKKDDGLIEIGAKDDKFAPVTVDVPHGKYKIKMIHHSGFLSCFMPLETTFGCLYPPSKLNFIDISVTDNQNRVLLPKVTDSKGYSHDGNVSLSKYIIFNDVIELQPGQQLRFWFTEDRTNGGDQDNGGVAKFHAYGMLQQKISPPFSHGGEL